VIVICTPTGLIGRQVLGHVLDGGGSRPVRVIARDPARLPRLVRERVEVVQGSLTDVAVVARAFAGADSVFWLVPPNPQAESVEGHLLDFTRPLCAAIGGQGVSRLVYVTGLGEVARIAAPGSAQPAVGELIASTGVSYRALACPAFMDNLLQQLELIKSQGMFCYPISGQRKLPACATCDIAAIAARLLVHSWSGQDSVPVLGPEDLSYDDMAHIMSEVLGRPIRYQPVPGQTFQATLMQHGMSRAWAERLVDRMAQVDRGLYNAEPRTPQSTTPTSFRQWCEDVLKPAFVA